MTAQIITLTPRTTSRPGHKPGRLISLPMSAAGLPRKLHFRGLNGPAYRAYDLVGFRLPQLGEYVILAPGIPFADMVGNVFESVIDRAMFVVRPRD